MPSASITSALPTDDVTARLPCLATVTPAAAHRMATVVEMLNVLKRSPPVPTTSRISRESRQVRRRAAAGWICRARRGRRRRFRPAFRLFAQRGQKIGLDGRWNFFVGQLFHGLTYLRFRERLRGGELLGQFFEHGRF